MQTMRRSWSGRRLRGRDEGSAAVEFALVLWPLLLIFFGIVNYGFWFNDSLSVRQGVREGARKAVVLKASTACTTLGGTTLAAYACGTRAQIVTAGGVSYAKVLYPTSPGWVRGGEVVVCGMVKSINFTGFVPLPAGGMIKSKTTMSIESVTPVPTGSISAGITSYADTLPSGEGDWSWCTS